MLSPFLHSHTGEPKYILTEYASNGDLKNYLISLTLLSTGSETVLIKVARDIAKALSFMFTKGVMHKDIAARNVFLTKDFTAKIGDFGLGRDVYERLGSDYHSLIWVNQNCRFPVRWMPPEFLVEGRFSLEGDRWSYGILLWEIGSLGGSPMMDVAVENLLEYLQQGNRPIKPEGCTHRAYQIMQRCWHEDRYKRPTPDQLIAEFEYMLRTQVNISQRFFTEAFKERFSNRTSDQYSSMDELNDLND
ncbi:fibroblast growth factor receptor 3-like [Ptychodera flava]|uniref:fibroblast growth factor receptor 3-like n=1 Tax=Ptychodera flava TaxID=63121 RepID=UPI003969F76C